MEIKALSKDIQSLKAVLNGKKRICTYGAGNLAADLNKLLCKYGYQIDHYIVDDCYYSETVSDDNAGNTAVISMSEYRATYDFRSDALLWAIGFPEKLRACMDDNNDSMVCYLIWEYLDFWENKECLSAQKESFIKASKLLYDDYSKKVFWSYLNALKGNICDDIANSTGGAYFNELTKGKREGAFVDCGAYDGDSTISYLEYIKGSCTVYAFEPDKGNFSKLTKRMKNRPDVICINKGCYSSEKSLSFVSECDMSSSLQETGDDIVDVTTIDKVVGNNRVAFIKMDVEGSELEGLKGARHVIERDMPILAISAYHRPEDLITLIPYIASLHNEREKYDLYLRHHGVVQTELVIYGIPVAV